ncbi:MAG: carboxymuconolactone decarboxylase family protein [Acidobacteria bacterium]|nr:carboxymuconolactone decarboxylase family protein [Acidobacteriota bacterium]
MPKYLPVQLDAAGEHVREVYKNYEISFGVPADNVVKTLAPSSTFLEAYYRMFRTVMGDISLNDKMRELAILKVAKLNGCQYCLHHHTILGRKAGITDGMVAALEDHEKSDLFTFAEKELLSWTSGVTRNPGSIDEELFKQLKNHFTQQQVIELTTIAAFFNMVTRLCQSLEIEIEGQKKAAGHG